MAESARYLPSNILGTVVSDMKNYSKTQIRMTPSTGSTPVKSGDVTVFKLPNAKVVDLATLRFNLHCATNGTQTEVVGLPKYISSLIHQFEIWCNGKSVMNISRYNHIYNIVRDYSGDYEKYQKNYSIILILLLIILQMMLGLLLNTTRIPLLLETMLFLV